MSSVVCRVILGYSGWRVFDQKWVTIRIKERIKDIKGWNIGRGFPPTQWGGVSWPLPRKNLQFIPAKPILGMDVNYYYYNHSTALWILSRTWM